MLNIYINPLFHKLSPDFIFRASAIFHTFFFLTQPTAPPFSPGQESAGTGLAELIYFFLI